MEFLFQYGLFLAKAVTILAAVVISVGLVAGITMRGGKEDSKGSIKITDLNDQYQDVVDVVQQATLNEAEVKKQLKDQQKQAKKDAKQEKAAIKKGEAAKPKPRMFVLEFDGDIKASAVADLRRCITAVLSTATSDDEVLVKLESGGGMVHSYGLAASQLHRITKKGVPLTIAVDKVAASGGYMMACVANKIIAAPFAIIGSIGVMAQLPNLNKLLKKNDIDYELYTAGEYKRTVTVFGENTAKGREKFQDDLNKTHELFKQHISAHRESVDVESVATGEVWYGQQALENGLIDHIATSDEYMVDQLADKRLLAVTFAAKKTLAERLGFAAEASVDRFITRWLTRLVDTKPKF